MDSFNVIISPKALSQLNSYIDYLQYTLLNDQAARNVWQDALETRNQASSLYRMEDQNVYEDAIYHQLQDYENTFSDELNHNNIQVLHSMEERNQKY